MKYSVENNHIADLRNSERLKRLEQNTEVFINSENEWTRLFDFDEWDRRLFIDARLGRLDPLLEKAKKDYKEGNTKPLP